MGKWTKPDLSNLENDLSNNSIKSISWSVSAKKLYIKNKEKLSECFFEKIGKKQRTAKFNLQNDL